MTGRILPPISLILPLWLVRSMVGWRETFEVWPALAVSGLSFAAMQFYWANFQENGLVDIVAAIFSLLVMVAFLKVWQPATTPDDGEFAGSARRHPATFNGRGAQRLVAVHSRVDPDLRRGAAGAEPAAHLRVAQAAGPVPPQPGLSRAAGGSCAVARSGDRRLELHRAPRDRGVRRCRDCRDDSRHAVASRAADSRTDLHRSDARRFWRSVSWWGWRS